MESKLNKTRMISTIGNPKIASLSLLFFIAVLFNSINSMGMGGSIRESKFDQVDIARHCLNTNGLFEYPCIVHIPERSAVLQVINNGSEIQIDSNFEIKGIKFRGNAVQTSEQQSSKQEGFDTIFIEINFLDVDSEIEIHEFQSQWMSIRGIRKVVFSPVKSGNKNHELISYISEVTLQIPDEQTMKLRNLDSKALLDQYQKAMTALTRWETIVGETGLLRIQRLKDSLSQGVKLMSPKSGVMISNINHNVIENLRRTYLLLTGFLRTFTRSNQSEFALVEFSLLKRFQDDIQYLTGWDDATVLQGSQAFTAISVALYDQLVILNSLILQTEGVRPQVLNELLSSTLKFGNAAKSSRGGDVRAIESIRSFATTWNSPEWQRMFRLLVPDQNTRINETGRIGLNLVDLVSELSVLSGVTFKTPSIHLSTIQNQK